MSGQSYQSRVRDWVAACFPPFAQCDHAERTHRFLEEALELAQANGCSQSDAHALVEYVFGRPEGDLIEETGGVLVTLAALCNVAGVDMEDAGERELSRNWHRIDKIRAKHDSRPAASPLPQ